MELKEMSEKIKNELTIDQIYSFLLSFGGDPQLKNGLIISRTICHGGYSHKLYYYDNTKLFKCYTDCFDTFDIFELVLKINKINGKEISLPQAVKFIADYFGIYFNLSIQEKEDDELKDWKILDRYEQTSLKKEEEKIIDFKYYDTKILKYLPHPRILNWEQEGIKPEIMRECGICYDPVMQGIVIPHYNIDGQLIGIRERTLIKENEDTGKYKPAILNYKMYNHALGFNLYNLNKSKENIVFYKKAIIFEGEKSCLLYRSYFPENDISVAVCGSNLTKYQVDLLLSLEVDEICIAFDKQFKEIGDIEWKNWTKKLKDIYKKYGTKVKITFLFDKWNLLEYKDSPIDKGKDIFQELFKRRISL